MTKEHKELLFKDLCARLPYGVKLQFSYITTSPAILTGIDNDLIICDIAICELEDVKPYLFPLSSMTEEQKNEFKLLFDLNYASAYCQEIQIAANMIKWLNKNHFDIYGLIPKGLANDATGLNIY